MGSALIQQYIADTLARFLDKEKHKEFKQKRKGHYSNEAEAMRLAQSLMAQESPEDETDEQ